MDLLDELLDIANARTTTPLGLNITRSHITLGDGRRTKQVLLFRPRKKFLRVRFGIDDADPWIERLEEAGLSASKTRRGYPVVLVTPDEFVKHKEILTELVHAAIDEDCS